MDGERELLSKLVLKLFTYTFLLDPPLSYSHHMSKAKDQVKTLCTSHSHTSLNTFWRCQCPQVYEYCSLT